MDIYLTTAGNIQMVQIACLNLSIVRRPPQEMESRALQVVKYIGKQNRLLQTGVPSKHNRFKLQHYKPELRRRLSQACTVLDLALSV